ncbi:unnamed protein product [Rhizophagus irregularis]|nr:unnamed protein product [Rhizophagus irregularis]
MYLEKIFVKSIESPYYNIIYIVWGIFTETIPRNLNPKIGSNGNIYLLSNDHILRLNDGNEERSIVRQPAYEERCKFDRNFRLCIQGSGSITFRLSDYLSGPDRIRDKKRLNLKASWALSECEEHISEKIDVYVKTVKSLKNIIKSNMRKTKREKARTLLDRYMKTFCRATKSVLRHGRTSRFCCLMFKTSCRLSIRPDRQEARTWRKERNRKMCTPSVHIETNNAGPPMAEPFLLD